MNVGILIPGFSNGEQDWCIPVYLNLVRALAQTDSVRVIAMRYPPRRDRYPVYGAQVIPMNGGSYTAGFRRWILLARTIAAVILQHRRCRFDVLHAIWADETGFAACVAGRIIGVPVVVSIAGGELASLPGPGYGLQTGQVSRWLVARALDLADRITAPSEYVANLAKQKTTRTDRIQIVPLGVDTRLFTPTRFGHSLHGVAYSDFGKNDELLAVGSLIPVKGHHLLLEVVANLALEFPRLTLDIVGEGPLLQALQSQAERLGIANRVTFYGAISHDELPNLYQNADLHILTSGHEAFGMVVVEAAACGLPTVGFALGVLPEFAPHAAVAIPPGDVEALTQAARDLLKDFERRRSLGRAALILAQTRYSVEIMVTAIRDTYLALTKPPTV